VIQIIRNITIPTHVTKGIPNMHKAKSIDIIADVIESISVAYY